MSTPYPPEGHPISEAKARELIAGDLGDLSRDILSRCCAPIYWFRRGVPGICNNGTVTLVRTPKRLMGITAAHVVRAFEEQRKEAALTLQLSDAVIDSFTDRLIDVSDKYDLATFALAEQDLRQLGKPVMPLETWPPRPPQEGRGIMIAGFPGKERREPGKGQVDFGLFTALVVARRVTDVQITWVVEREYHVENSKIQVPPPNYDLGGVSGGPLLAWFETGQHIAYHCLSGIVTEHPDYEKNEFAVERLVAIRADLMDENGRISK